jgi:hypothetical protein
MALASISVASVCGWGFDASAAVIHVRLGATGSGSSWADALGTVEEALDVAQEDDEIWVAIGTYHPKTSLAGSGVDRSFKVDGVDFEVFGGFPGTGTPTRPDRHADLYPTVLDGTFTEGGLSVSVRHVVQLANVTTAHRWHGFTITGGHAGQSGADFTDEFDDFGGGILCRPPSGEGQTSPVFQHCRIIDNKAIVGAGAHVRLAGFGPGPQSVAHFRNCEFAYNEAESYGGGLNSAGAMPLLVNCVVRSNHAHGAGGGISVARGGRVEAWNSTIVSNSADGSGTGSITFPTPSGGVAIASGLGSGNSASLVNSILWANAAMGQVGVDEQIGGNYEVHRCCIEDWPLNGGSESFGDDPDFVDLAGGDLRLEATSPCIDTGFGPTGTPPSGAGFGAFPLDEFDADDDNDLDEPVPDADRFDRVRQCEIDIGAFEFDLCPADVTRDGEVGPADLATLLGAFGVCWGCRSDLDRDGIVGPADLAILLGAWGTCPGDCEPLESLAAGGEAGCDGQRSTDAMAPTEVMDLFGLASVEELAAWLLELSPEVRAVLFEEVFGWTL